MVDLRFIFDDNAGNETLSLRGEPYRYLVKVRRHETGETIGFRRPDRTETLYLYEIISIEARAIGLRLQKKRESVVKADRSLHLGWCIIESKSIEKVLPMLNELGVEKITFIYCDRSQKNFRPDFRRFERILQASMQQCGRSQMMEFQMMDNIDTFVQSYPESIVLDFCDRVFDDSSDISHVIIGTEGGFSERERILFEALRIRRLDTPMILRSETAAAAVSAKILL